MAKQYTRNKIRRKTRKHMRGGVDLNETIPHTDDNSHNLDMSELNLSNGSLHLSDLNTSDNSGYTTEQSIVPGHFEDLDSIPPDE